ncbi:MAG TPA: DUF6766 family protein [Vitreimonas sp.]|nr:DUF6766 family protein [Vitreimonas sp.]
MQLMEKLLKDYNLSLTLLALFIFSWMGQAYFQWQEFVSNAQAHQQPAVVEEFMPEFWAATFENWQSEFLQLLSMVVLTSFLIHKGSAESRDSEDEIQASLHRIEKKLPRKSRRRK